MGLPLELLTAILQSLAEESSAPADRRRLGKGTMSVGDFFWLVEDRIGGMAHPGRDAGTFAHLKGMGIGALVSLTVVGLPGRLLKDHGLDYLHLPIEDYTPPRQEQIDEFVRFCERNISQGRPVAVHCLAGRGRTGTMLACYLVRQGMKADEAIERVRAVRPGAIETFEQEVAIHEYAARAQAPGPVDGHK
jgi:atypical dual specificity phosphatase